MADEQSQDQPKKESRTEDQAPEAGEGAGEQPAHSSDDADSQENAQGDPVYEIDGENVPLSELKAGYMRGRDYTQKTQKLAEKERQVARSGKPAPTQNVDPNDPQLKQAMAVLKGMGFMTKEEMDTSLRRIEVAQHDSKDLEGLLDANPDLKRFESALKAIGKTTGEAWEDIVVKHGFIEKTALKRAKAAKTVVGAPSPKKPAESDNEPKSGWTDAQYEAWRAKKNIGKNATFRKSSR
jgi:hypothetical protein